MKNYSGVLATSALVLALTSPLSHALDANLEIAQSSESTMVYGIGLKWDFERQWWQSSRGHLTGHWDAAYRYWQGDDTSSMHSVSITPIFVYEFNTERFKPYVEAGVGASLLSSTRFEGRSFGTAFNFVSHLGAGLKLSEQQSIGLRAMHYSNASIKQPNDGIETYSLYYRFGF